MNKLARVAAAALVALLCFSISAHAEGGVVRGQVYNGTAGAAGAPGGLPVRLYVFYGDTLKDTLRTTTDAQGMFRYEGVSTGSGWLAVAVVEYAGVEYESDMLDLSVGTDFNGDIAIYETTTDGSALSIEHSHLIIEMGAGQLEVAEVLTVANGGDRTYVGADEIVPDRRATTLVTLPAGATDVAFTFQEVADAMVRTGQGFVDTRPIAPGQHQYRFSYVLPCKGSSYSLVKPIPYSTAAVDILVAAPGAEVDAPGLQQLGTREASGVPYVHLGGTSLVQGTDLVIHLSGLGQPARTQPAGALSAGALAGAVRRAWWLNVVPAAVMVALAAAVIAHLLRTTPAAAAQPHGRIAAAVDDERNRLLSEMADLDERFAAGELEESGYRKQRQAAKGRLRGLLLGTKGGESDYSPEQSGRAAGSSAGGRPGKEVRPSGGARRRRPKPQRG